MTRIRPIATIAFVVLALGLAWLVALPLWLDGGLANPLASILIYVMMFTPAVAVLIVMLVLRPVPKGERLRFLGMWPLRPAKRVVWMMVTKAAIMNWMPIMVYRKSAQLRVRCRRRSIMAMLILTRATDQVDVISATRLSGAVWLM